MTDDAPKISGSNWLRIALCLMTFGFAFPNALMETADAAKAAHAKEQKEKAATAPDL